MNKIEEAIYFATKAHMGQKRKNDNVDMIFHPFSVGMMLQREGCGDETVMAGILHDVVEDTPYTFKDIEKQFGEKVSKLVYEASEPDKSLSWEERKKHTIDSIKSISLEGKLIICADKISNLSTLYKDYVNSGEKVWNCFKRGKEQQKWYYGELLNAIIASEKNEYPLLLRYKEIFNKVFSQEK